jgi:hypothetical protein
LAVAERADRGVCSIYDVATLKRKWVVSSNDYTSREFVSVNFCPSDEKKLVTLTSEPSINIIIWLWDKRRCFSYQPVTGVSGGMTCT